MPRQLGAGKPLFERALFCLEMEMEMGVRLTVLVARLALGSTSFTFYEHMVLSSHRLQIKCRYYTEIFYRYQKKLLYVH
jgi:hypothetical protein